MPPIFYLDNARAMCYNVFIRQRRKFSHQGERICLIIRIWRLFADLGGFANTVNGKIAILQKNYRNVFGRIIH